MATTAKKALIAKTFRHYIAIDETTGAVNTEET
jgi:hypothetical protein